MNITEINLKTCLFKADPYLLYKVKGAQQTIALSLQKLEARAIHLLQKKV